MVFWFGVVFDAVAFLGLVVFGLGMVSIFGGWFLLVSVLLDAVGCCFYIGALVGLVVWFLWRFWVFVEFCQFVPFRICEF